MDPDANYFHSARKTRLDDSDSEGEDDGTWFRRPTEGRGTPMGEFPRSKLAAGEGDGRKQGPLVKDPEETRERLEWQNMLSCVLRGDVLRGESSRQGIDRPTESFRRDYAAELWWGLRARIRSRTEIQERRRVEERRGRIVDGVLEEIERFEVKPSSGPVGVERRLSAENTAKSQYEANAIPNDSANSVDPDLASETSALDQVTFVLHKLDAIESLYPHSGILRADKSLYDSAKVQDRILALTAWSTVVQALQGQLHILQQWTGSDELDVTKPNTTKEKALVAKNRLRTEEASREPSLSAQVADDTTFLERVMKEENLQRTFEKRAFVDLTLLVRSAKAAVIAYGPLFEQLKLPDFTYELVRLIGFPPHLVIEALKTRLDAATKLTDPDPMVINDMLENFRLIMSITVMTRRQYHEIVSPDPQKRWQIPDCLPAEYDDVLLEAMRVFFKLLHWKLKSGSKAIYFRETELLEEEWLFLFECADAIPGGDVIMAEHFW